jgi:transposase
MANKTKSMLQIRRILQLLSEETSFREINRLTGMHRITIKEYANRIRESGKEISYLLNCSDPELSSYIFPQKSRIIDDPRRKWLEDNLPEFMNELQRPHVTRQLLWEEYREKQPQGCKRKPW